MKALLMLPVLCLALAGVSWARTTKIPLTSAISEGLVTVSAHKTAQSYNDKGLALVIENKSRQTLALQVDPALIFTPEDTTYQDLVIAGNVSTTIAPGASGRVLLQSYCAKSYARAPSTGLAFRFSHKGDSTMIKLLHFIGVHAVNKEVAQHAIWVLTNGHELGAVYDPAQDEASRRMIAFMAALLGQQLPDYYKLYYIDTAPGRPVFRRRALKIFADFRWTLEQPCQLTLAVYDSTGRIVDKMFEHKDFKRGRYELTAKFESADVAAGNYYIRLLGDGRVLEEKKVSVD